jgi:hypothetical protein
MPLEQAVISEMVLEQSLAYPILRSMLYGEWWAVAGYAADCIQRLSTLNVHAYFSGCALVDHTVNDDVVALANK